jgi:hypothetical protein
VLRLWKIVRRIQEWKIILNRAKKKKKSSGEKGGRKADERVTPRKMRKIADGKRMGQMKIAENWPADRSNWGGQGPLEVHGSAVVENW